MTSLIKCKNLFGILSYLRVKFKVRLRHFIIERQKFSESENSELKTYYKLMSKSFKRTPKKSPSGENFY